MPKSYWWTWLDITDIGALAKGSVNAAREDVQHDECPYCVRAEQLLTRKGVRDFEKINVDRLPEEREKMMALTGRRSVPQIFIAGTSAVSMSLPGWSAQASWVHYSIQRKSRIPSEQSPAACLASTI